MQAPKHIAGGGVLQGGIPMRKGPPASPASRLLRGVVMATYVTDDPNHPYAAFTPCAVYCDVLVYSQASGSKSYFIPKALVSQPTGGLHRGRIWKPRASTPIDVTGNAVDPNRATNPANLDGDHVLLGFIDDATNVPVILRGLPHPSIDVGNTNHSVGHRMRLKVADGDPDFLKHHGTYYGVSTTGDFVVDTTFANDGTLQASGATAGQEAAPPTDGSKGNQLYNLEQHCKRLTSLMDMSSPDAPNAVLTELLNVTNYVLNFLNLTPNWQLKNTNGNCVTAQGVAANATLALGDGSKHVPIVEQLQAMYTSLKTKLDAFDAHVHPSSMGPTGAPTPLVQAPAWDNSINSTKLSIPNG